jgi:glycosyltransferase involved in cell wall biosynthesis
MKILLDPQIFKAQFFGGISRYFAELLYHAPKIESELEVKCPLPHHSNLHLKEKKLLPVSAFNKLLFNFQFRGSNKIKSHFLDYKKATIAALKKQDFDVFVPTYFDPYFLPYIERKPFVLTVYDMIIELFPQYFNNEGALIEWKKVLIEKATTVIAISESTKIDILRLYPHIDANKIKVVYLSHSIDTTEKLIPVSGLPNRYILFVGNRSFYKNFVFFIKAMAQLLKADANLYVVCAGGGSFKTEEVLLINDLGISNQVVQKNFEDNELASFYKNAEVFVFPSQYEGFGIPVLEAMHCCCPVILANHSSFPEVAGDAGIYFELDNEADLRTKVEAIIGNAMLREQYIAAGTLQAKRFSWQKTVKECLEIFQQAVNETQ